MKQPRRSEPLPLGGPDQPFSKGLMARSLIAVGVRPVRAHELARRVDADLHERGAQRIELARLEELAVAVLGEEDGGDAIRRLRRYRELEELDLPILLFIGGTTGTGKSTVATEAAYRLGITRVTSTDFVRQTLRAFFSPDFMPTVHYSSFEAWKGLSEPEAAEDPVVAGFLEQTRHVMVGVRASIERALEEGWSMVLEGVHLVPGIVPPIDGALVVQCVLAIETVEEHRAHFLIRDFTTDGARHHDKYTEALDDIRRIQGHILRRAARTGVPVLENRGSIESTIGAVLELVYAGAEQVQQV
jgi:2-phosphoglycerate kinase